MQQHIDLQKRWSDQYVDQIEEAIGRSKKDGYKRKSLPESPFGRTIPVDLADFRGYPLFRMVAVTASKVDFSYATSSVDNATDLWECLIENCLFRQTRYFHHLSGRFTNCDFSGARGTKCHFSGEFIDCRF